MKQRLSVSAVPGPPVETVIVPRTDIAASASVAPARRSRARFRLRGPVAVNSPPAVLRDIVTLLAPRARRKTRPSFLAGPTVVAVTATSVRDISVSLVPSPRQVRASRSRLRQPVAVTAAVVLSPPPKTRLAPQTRIPRTRTMAGVRAPRLVLARQAFSGIMVQYVQPPRRRTMSVLQPPTVVNP